MNLLYNRSFCTVCEAMNRLKTSQCLLLGDTFQCCTATYLKQYSNPAPHTLDFLQTFLKMPLTTTYSQKSIFVAKQPFCNRHTFRNPLQGIFYHTTEVAQNQKAVHKVRACRRDTGEAPEHVSWSDQVLTVTKMTRRKGLMIGTIENDSWKLASASAFHTQPRMILQGTCVLQIPTFLGSSSTGFSSFWNNVETKKSARLSIHVNGLALLCTYPGIPSQLC